MRRFTKTMTLAFALGAALLGAGAQEANAQWRYGWGGPYGYGYGPGYGYGYGYGYRSWRRPYVYAPRYVYGAPVVVVPRYRRYGYGWYGPRTSNLRSGFVRVSPNYDRW